eukprot:TRINITY_DN6469_c0_g1_i1.p1 TRINITY_DN6469_c0_g1~~TRINITY_DN6469_c0_g1_i1.p1  ORF type:complete len:309 (+),score=71.22 TRINITY_DN6469_c0_g1_i1:62-988(+)
MAQKAAAARPVLLPCLLLATACLCFCFGGSFLVPSSFRSSTGLSAGSSTTGRQLRTAMYAKDADDDDDDGGDDSVEVSGFSGFVIGLAFLPHVCYALVTAFNVSVQGQNFDYGPYGLEALSCTVSIGLVFWSLGSFLGRGRGLPAGPLGLLGLSEGLSYLAAFGLAIAAAVSSVRTGGAPSMPKISAPSAPQISAPSMPSMPKAPEFKAPEFKAPEFKAPEIKVPDVKLPDVKVPEFKAPDIKVPDVKLPEAPKPAPAAPKKEEPKPAPAPAPAPPPPPPAPKKEEAKPPPPPAAKPSKAVDYGDLFD